MFTFKIIPDGGDPFEVTATSRDVVRWERTGKGRSLGRFEQNPTMTDLYGLAYAATQRTGAWTGRVEEFEDSVDVELQRPADADEDDKDGSGPTRPGR